MIPLTLLLTTWLRWENVRKLLIILSEFLRFILNKIVLKLYYKLQGLNKSFNRFRFLLNSLIYYFTPYFLILHST